MRNIFIVTALLACTSTAALAQTVTTPTQAPAAGSNMPVNGAKMPLNGADTSAAGALKTQDPVNAPVSGATTNIGVASPTKSDGNLSTQMTYTLNNSDMLTSNIVGLEIYDGAKNDIGKIDAIAFDKAKTVDAYILSVGGFLGMGVHYVVVSPDSVIITYNAGDKKWGGTMDTTKAQMKAMPEFKFENQWAASNS